MNLYELYKVMVEDYHLEISYEEFVKKYKENNK